MHTIETASKLNPSSVNQVKLSDEIFLSAKILARKIVSARTELRTIIWLENDPPSREDSVNFARGMTLIDTFSFVSLKFRDGCRSCYFGGLTLKRG